MEKWYKPGAETGWHKSQKAVTRRRLALKAHKGNALSAGRSLQALANVTKDKRTAQLAGQDARYFFRKNRG